MLKSLDIETLCLVISQKYSNLFFLQKRKNLTISQLLSMEKGFGVSALSCAELADDYTHTEGRGRNYRHTLFYCTSLYCASQMFRFLQIEGKALQQ